MKKTIILILTLSLILGVFSSCGHKSIYATTSTADTETVEITTTDETITEENFSEEITTEETTTASIEIAIDDTATSDTEKNGNDTVLKPGSPEWLEEVMNPDNWTGGHPIS